MASGAAKRYAQAVLSLARDEGRMAEWQADLALLNDVMTDPEAAAALQNPSISDQEKLGVLDAVLARGSGQPEARNLVRLLLHRQRIDIIPELNRLFNEAVLADQGIVIADVTTAEPLDAAQEAMVRKRLSALVGKQVQLQTKVDPSIIGGIVALIGDQLIDGSVVNQLRRLRTRLGAA